MSVRRAMSVRKALMVLYRVCWLVFVVLVLIGVFAEPLLPFGLTFVPAVVAVAIGFALSRSGPKEALKDRPAVEVDPPVTGRWSALNSPADKVPSHGTHVYGQTYAIDIVAEPETGDGESPARPRSACSGRSSGATATSRPSAPRCSRWPTPRSSGRATAGATT